MKKISIRNLIIVLLCICIICMALGYTVLSMKLKEYKGKDIKYDVSIIGVQEERILKGGNTKPVYTYNIKNDGLTILTDNKLYSPNDEISYYIIIKNNGTIDSEIINLSYSQDILNNNKTKPITVKITDITGKVLTPGEETKVKMTFTYEKVTEVKEKNITFETSLLTKPAK